MPHKTLAVGFMEVKHRIQDEENYLRHITELIPITELDVNKIVKVRETGPSRKLRNTKYYGSMLKMLDE